MAPKGTTPLSTAIRYRSLRIRSIHPHFSTPTTTTRLRSITTAPVTTSTSSASTPIVTRPTPLENVQSPVIEPSPLLTRVKRPVGAIRGGLIGFLLGSTLVGIYGYTHLLNDYTIASQTLLESVQELKESTQKMSQHFERIEQVETKVEKLIKESSTNHQVETLRSEYRRLLDAEHLEVLALKSHVWGIEQDLQSLTKGSTNTFRI